MKKAIVLCLCLAVLMTGCAKKEPIQSPIEEIPSQSPVQPEASQEVTVGIIDNEQAEINSELISVSVPLICEQVNAEDGTELFAYQRQHMQLTFPNAEVAEKVILDFLNRVDATGEDAEFILEAAKNDYTPNSQWFPYFYQVVYNPTRIDYGVLSLFGVQNSFSGGMHGSKSCVAANYDMMTGDILTLGSIMHMDATKEDFIKIIIEKLESNADFLGLYSGFEEGVQSRLSVDEHLYEDFYFTTTGLCFFFAPYEIAPYTSGIITVEIPYNELPGLIYDGYFPAERQQIHGHMLVDFFKNTDMDQFSNIAEANLTANGEQMVIYPEGTVENIRIMISGDGKMMPDYTVFAAYEMRDHDAIVLAIDPDMVDDVSVSYFSGETQITMPLAE